MHSPVKNWLGHWLIFTLLAALVMLPSLQNYGMPERLLAATYLPLAVLGWSFVLSLLLAIVLLIPSLLLPKTSRVLWVLGGGALLFLLLLDTQIFRIYNFHMNAFMVNMFFADPKGMGVTAPAVIGGVLALIGLFTLLYWALPVLLRLVRKPGRWLLSLLLATTIGQLIHAWGYAHNMQAIVSVTHYIPWYTPMTATKDIKNLGLFNEALLEENIAMGMGEAKNFNYPTQPLQCANTEQQPLNIIMVVVESLRFDRLTPEVMPNTYAMAQTGQLFTNHLGTGTVTDRGLFGLMYGASPVYFNSAMGASKLPAVLQATELLGYEHIIYLYNGIGFNKLDTLLFGSLPYHTSTVSSVPDADADLMRRFSADVTATNDPYFGFVFLQSSHFPYWTPEGYNNPFLPAEQLRMSQVTNSSDPIPFFNQYSNSIHYMDSLIGELIDNLKSTGQWDSTVLIVTGDHGEEFRDSSKPYWGHGSNFARFQLGVPLAIHWPGREPLVANYRTSHEDITPTLITEALACDVPIETVSTGRSLFDNTPRTLIAASYVNEAIVSEDTVTALFPGFVRTYSLEDAGEQKQPDASVMQAIQPVYQRFR